MCATLFILTSLSQLKAQTQYLHPDQQMLFNCDGVVTLNIMNSNPSLIITQDVVTGLIGTSSIFEPGAGTLNIIFGNIEGPASYGTVSFLVDDNGVQSSFNIYIINCCIKNFSPDLIIVNQAISSLPSPNLVNQKILVLDEFFIDNPSLFFRCNIYMGADASIRLQQGIHLSVEQCTIKNFCGYRWDGIFANHDYTEIQIAESEISGAARAVFIEDNVSFLSTNTTYKDNVRSISGTNYSQSGNYYNYSRWQLRGNIFNSVSAPLGFHHLSLVPGHIADVAQFRYIDLKNCLNIQIGEIYQTRNIFNAIEGYSVHAANCEDLNIENNNFGISSNGIKLDNCKAVIGSTSLTYGNRFGSTNGIFSESSYQEIGFNLFRYSSVEIRNPGNYLNGSLESVLLYSNEAEFTDFDIYYTAGIYTADVIIEFNKIINGSLSLTNIHTNSISNGARVQYNEFGWCSLEYNKFNVKLTSTPGIRFGENAFKLMNVPFPSTCPVPPAGIRGRGMLAFDVPNAQFKPNSFNECTLGFYGEGDFTNTQFSFNSFTDNDTGMYFYDALLTDHGINDPTYPHTGNRMPANIWSGNHLKNLVIEQSASFTGLTSKYVCEGVFSGYSYFYNPKNLSPTNTNGFDRKGSGNNTWQIAAVITYNINGYGMPVQHVSDCGTLNKTSNPSATTNRSGFSFFPNPAQQNITYIIEDELAANAEIRIFNLQGQLIDELVITEKQGNIQLNCSAGTYFVVLFNGGEILKSRLVVAQ